MMAGGAERRVEVHGHRGARTVLPENSLPAFQHAIEAGAEYLELDLVATRDDVLVVSHDPVLSPAICRGPEGSRVVRELTLEQLKRFDCGAQQNPDFPRQKAIPGTPIPTLDEVLALAKQGRFRFNIETKITPAHPEHYPTPQRFAELLLAAIERHGVADRVMVQSFDFRTLREVKRLAPEIPRAALFSADTSEFPAVAERAGATMVSPHFRLVTREKVERARQQGIPVVAWTANDEKEWQRLVEAGVDGIITDDPAGLIAWMKSRGLR